MILTPNISVIIPVYNAEAFLNNCIESVVSQTLSNIEIILVNDGSIDNSFELMRKWESKDSRIICINQDNHGVTRARKRGVEVASAKWITFVDADDELPNDALENMFLQSGDCDIVIGQCYFVGKTKWPFPKFIATLTKKKYVQLLLQRKQIHWGPYAKLIKRELFKNDVLNIPRFITNGEDFLMNLQLAAQCNSVTIIDKDVYNYIRREGSAVTKDPWLSIKYSTLYEIWVWKSLKGIRSNTLKDFIIYSTKTGFVRFRHILANFLGLSRKR